LIINDAVLLPVYNDPHDAEAIKICERAFRGRDIIPIDCSVLIRQHGSLHCVTMQFPEEVGLRVQ
jgi:agmatine deiminase